MGNSAKKEKTVYEQRMELPDSVIGEIIGGELHVSPRPAPKHGHASSSLLGEVMGPFHKGRGGPGGWLILDEPEIHLEHEIMVPDIAGWRRERMPQIPDEAFFSIAPDWVCEVLSPSTAKIDRVKKMPLYVRYGVKHIWLIDPIEKILKVYQNENSRWVLIQTNMNDDKVRAVPFDAIEIELSSLWS